MDEIKKLEKEYATAKRMMARYYNFSIKEEHEKGDAWMLKCRELRSKIEELKAKEKEIFIVEDKNANIHYGKIN